MNLSGLTHFVATLLSIAGLSVLVTLGAIKGTAVHIVSFSIFGASLIMLYLASTLYHFLSRDHPKKDLFQTIDHMMIYVLIAGTYTPLALIVLPTAWGWSIFGAIWGLAFAGIIIKSFRLRVPRWFPSVFYLLMGWLIVVAFVPLRNVISPEGFFWLILGGLFYTAGTIFFALDGISPRKDWYTYHDIFHIFVMCGSLAHFWFMFKFVI